LREENGVAESGGLIDGAAESVDLIWNKPFHSSSLLLPAKWATAVETIDYAQKKL